MGPEWITLNYVGRIGLPPAPEDAISPRIYLRAEKCYLRPLSWERRSTFHVRRFRAYTFATQHVAEKRLLATREKPPRRWIFSGRKPATSVYVLRHSMNHKTAQLQTGLYSKEKVKLIYCTHISLWGATRAKSPFGGMVQSNAFCGGNKDGEWDRKAIIFPSFFLPFFPSLFFFFDHTSSCSLSPRKVSMDMAANIALVFRLPFPPWSVLQVTYRYTWDCIRSSRIKINVTTSLMCRIDFDADTDELGKPYALQDLYIIQSADKFTSRVLTIYSASIPSTIRRPNCGFLLFLTFCRPPFLFIFALRRCITYHNSLHVTLRSKMHALGCGGKCVRSWERMVPAVPADKFWRSAAPVYPTCLTLRASNISMIIR